MAWHYRKTSWCSTSLNIRPTLHSCPNNLTFQLVSFFFFFYIFASPEHLIWDSVHSVLGLSGCLQCFGHFVFSLAVKKPDQGRALSMGPFYLIASSNLANRPIIVIDCPGAFDAFNSVAIRICHRDTVCLATQAVFSTHFSYIAWLLLTKFESL